jgi:hypothetical protein
MIFVVHDLSEKVLNVVRKVVADSNALLSRKNVPLFPESAKQPDVQVPLMPVASADEGFCGPEPPPWQVDKRKNETTIAAVGSNTETSVLEFNDMDSLTDCYWWLSPILAYF